MIITKLVVLGQPKIEDKDDRTYGIARVDGGIERYLKVTIRRFLHDGHPLEIYINGSTPLYPTVVYAENGELLGVSAGLLGVAEDE